MKLSNSPLYSRINTIDDPSYRSMVFYIVEDLWTEFYDKDIIGISRLHRKGQSICYSILDEWELFAYEMNLSKKERDQGRVLCFLEPAWIGSQYVSDKQPGYRKMQNGLFRNPRWKEEGKSKFQRRLWTYMDKFFVSDLAELFRDCYDDGYKSKVSLIYKLSLISAVRRK